MTVYDFVEFLNENNTSFIKTKENTQILKSAM